MTVVRRDLRGVQPTHSRGHENCVVCHGEPSHVEVVTRPTVRIPLQGVVSRGTEQHSVYCCPIHTTIGTT